MTDTLKLTKKELEQFINNRLPERFEEVFDDIPMYHPDHVIVKGETHRQYVEDDVVNIVGLFLKIFKQILSIVLITLTIQSGPMILWITLQILSL